MTDADDDGAVPGAFGGLPMNSCWRRAERHPKKLYCGLCWSAILGVILVAIIIVAIPGSGTRVKYDVFTARIDYEYVEGRPMDMVMAVSKSGKYASWIHGVSRPGSLESLELHDGNVVTLVEKVFDRYICDKLSTDSSRALTIDNESPDWLLEDSDIPCPSGSEVNQSSHCEKWRHSTFIGNGFYESFLILDKKSKLPLFYSQSLADTKVSMKFKSFIVGEPNETLFNIPDGVKCVDYTVDPPSTAFDDSTLINDPRVIEEVSREAEANGWKAVANKRFDGVTFGSLKQSMMGNSLSPFILRHRVTPYSDHSSSRVVKRTFDPNLKIPESYDARKEYPMCTTLSQISDQKTCGCCYAMAAATSLAGRMCIATNGTFDKQLSTQWIIGCDDTTLGCNGGWVESVWHFLQRNGTTTSTCSSFMGVQSKCHSMCDNGDNVTLYRTEEPVDLHDKDPEKTVQIIQQEIMTHGPVEAAYYVFKDFMHLGSDVYKRTKKTTFQGGHAVRVIGWGTEKGTPYWLVANTWGTDWGDKGFFKIIRGKNECGFEDRMTAAVPILP